MFFATGYPCVAIISVKNNTDDLIGKVEFIYNSDDIETKIKKIKPDDMKQTGISTLNDINNLRMVVDGCSKSYLIRENIPKSYIEKLVIMINSINTDECKFEIQEVKTNG